MNEKELSRKDVENIYYKVRCYYEVKAKLYEDILNFDTPYMYNYICKDYIYDIRLSAWSSMHDNNSKWNTSTIWLYIMGNNSKFWQVWILVH